MLERKESVLAHTHTRVMFSEIQNTYNTGTQKIKINKIQLKFMKKNHADAFVREVTLQIIKQNAIVV